jgi:glycosyltransferase involved in cell wall biosynthesis
MSQRQLFDKYSEFDALVLPSVFEGFGLVVVEAMAAGLPVITTPNSIGPELIDSGSNGYIVPIRDPLAISRAIEDLSKKSAAERNAMRKLSRKKALEFSWTAYTGRLKLMLDSI